MSDKPKLSAFMDFVNATDSGPKWRDTWLHMMASSGVPIERMSLGELSEAELRRFCEIRNTQEGIRELMRGKTLADMYPPGTEFTRDEIGLSEDGWWHIPPKADEEDC